MLELLKVRALKLLLCLSFVFLSLREVRPLLLSLLAFQKQKVMKRFETGINVGGDDYNANYKHNLQLCKEVGFLFCFF